MDALTPIAVVFVLLGVVCAQLINIIISLEEILTLYSMYKDDEAYLLLFITIVNVIVFLILCPIVLNYIS